MIDGKSVGMRRNHFSIRRIIFIFLLCLVSGSILAQKVKLDTITVDQLNQYIDKAVRMRNTGTILGFSGLGIVAASYIVGNNIANIPSDDPYDPNKNELKGLAVGLLSGMAGMATMVVSIYLRAIGEKRYIKAELTLQKFDIIPKNSMALRVE